MARDTQRRRWDPLALRTPLRLKPFDAVSFRAVGERRDLGIPIYTTPQVLILLLILYQGVVLGGECASMSVLPPSALQLASRHRWE